MPYENIIYEKDERDNRIANIVLNRPEQMNALSQPLLDELFDAMEQADRDAGIGVLVFKGKGRSFSSGYDWVGPTGAGPAEYVAPTIGGARQRLILTVDRYFRLWSLRKPTIAQVHGYCLSGATELMAMCDIAIAAEDTRFGHIAGRNDGTLRTGSLWPFTIGMRKTKELLFTGDFIDGKTAERWGMINKAVPADELEEEVLDMARRILRIPTEVISLHKGMVNTFFENMGIHSSMMTAAFYDAAAAFTGPQGDFRKLIAEKGLREALRQRDEPWREHKRIKLPKEPKKDL